MENLKEASLHVRLQGQLRDLVAADAKALEPGKQSMSTVVREILEQHYAETQALPHSA
jgi:hypothetical protein